MSPYKRSHVVVPIDFSDESGEAINAALEFVDDPSQVHVVHVLFPLDAISPGVVWGEVTNERREQKVHEVFDKFLQEKQISGVSLDVRFGDPGLEIADYAKETGADLIVIPSHGYHGVKRFVLGSVAERVIRHAPCPVLVLRRKDAR